MDDPFDLERFLAAQNADEVYQRAVQELRDGRKRTHWMWFIFPQIAGLGQSAQSRYFAISGLVEATAYVQHPVLGPRLMACTTAVAAIQGRTAEQIFGGIDATKLRSSMTLFQRAAADEPLFGVVLDRYFDGSPDEATERLL